jgi:hypothetical protein
MRRRRTEACSEEPAGDARKIVWSKRHGLSAVGRRPGAALELRLPGRSSPRDRTCGTRFCASSWGAALVSRITRRTYDPSRTLSGSITATCHGGQSRALARLPAQQPAGCPSWGISFRREKAIRAVGSYLRSTTVRRSTTFYNVERRTVICSRATPGEVIYTNVSTSSGPPPPPPPPPPFNEHSHVHRAISTWHLSVTPPWDITRICTLGAVLESNPIQSLLTAFRGGQAAHLLRRRRTIEVRPALAGRVRQFLVFHAARAPRRFSAGPTQVHSGGSSACRG